MQKLKSKPIISKKHSEGKVGYLEGCPQLQLVIHGVRWLMLEESSEVNTAT
jgi:hypothetical protein